MINHRHVGQNGKGAIATKLDGSSLSRKELGVIRSRQSSGFEHNSARSVNIAQTMVQGRPKTQLTIDPSVVKNNPESRLPILCYRNTMIDVQNTSYGAVGSAFPKLRSVVQFFPNGRSPVAIALCSVSGHLIGDGTFHTGSIVATKIVLIQRKLQLYPCSVHHEDIRHRLIPGGIIRTNSGKHVITAIGIYTAGQSFVGLHLNLCTKTTEVGAGQCPIIIQHLSPIFGRNSNVRLIGRLYTYCPIAAAVGLHLKSYRSILTVKTYRKIKTAGTRCQIL